MAQETVLSVEAAGFAAAGLQILENISMEVREREFVCIVGASGCGKTTLLRLLAGLLTPGSGRVRYRGAPLPGPQRELALVFQDYGRALLPWRTVAGNVALTLEARGVPAGERPAIVQDVLARVGLAGRDGAFPRQLSGGMQQRVQIARCLAQQPRVLLMDEPFGALDAMTRQSLQDEVAHLCQDAGVTVVFITHDLEEAIYLGDRVLAMEQKPGRICAELAIDLPRPRQQLSTREDARFLAWRHELFGLLHAH